MSQQSGRGSMNSCICAVSFYSAETPLALINHHYLFDIVAYAYTVL